MRRFNVSTRAISRREIKSFDGSGESIKRPIASDLSSTCSRKNCRTFVVVFTSSSEIQRSIVQFVMIVVCAGDAGGSKWQCEGEGGGGEVILNSKMHTSTRPKFWKHPIGKPESRSNRDENCSECESKARMFRDILYYILMIWNIRSALYNTAWRMLWKMCVTLTEGPATIIK